MVGMQRARISPSLSRNDMKSRASHIASQERADARKVIDEQLSDHDVNDTPRGGAIRSW